MKGSGRKSEFIYDALGRLTIIREWQSNSLMNVVSQVWAGSRIREVRVGTNAVPTQRIYTQGLEVATERTNEVRLFTYDHLGSVREVLDKDSAVIGRLNYDTWGSINAIGTIPDGASIFAGLRYHAASGLFMAVHRAYQPLLGRWISRDPAGGRLRGSDYGYVMNRPAESVDPLGLWGVFGFCSFEVIGPGYGVHPVYEIVDLVGWDSEENSLYQERINAVGGAVEIGDVEYGAVYGNAKDTCGHKDRILIQNLGVETPGGILGLGGGSFVTGREGGYFGYGSTGVKPGGWLPWLPGFSFSCGLGFNF